MGPFFRVCSCVVLALWGLLLASVLVPLIVKLTEQGVASATQFVQESALLAGWGLALLLGLLPTAAILHLAGEVSVIASRHREPRVPPAIRGPDETASSGSPE